MGRVDVLNEVLKWSLDRPPWQRDALRRLVTKGKFNEVDIPELSQLCKSRHGLSDVTKPIPLEESHLPRPDVMKKPVALNSLTHHIGVNALAQEQTIEFGPELTVVYGANAAGKSGYTRILKRACRARGAEDILGNVMSGAAPGRPSATIKFTVDDESCEHLWDDNQSPNAFLSRVSVFDHHCASVYVAQRTDVAFRPLGLDLFDKLSDVSEEVRKVLEGERSALVTQELRFPKVAEGTAVHELIANLSSLTNPESVKELASLSEAEKARGEEVRRRIHDLQSDAPEKTARAIDMYAKRAGVLVTRVKTANEVLSDKAVAELFAARDQKNETRHIAEELHRAAFKEQPLPNTGTDTWRTLWDAAERFSTVDAYPNRAFPFTEEDSRCVLCQQELTNEGTGRLQQFQECLSSAAQGEHDRAAVKYHEKYTHINEVLLFDESVVEALDDLKLDNPDLTEEVRTCLESAEAQRIQLSKALTEDLPCPKNLLVQSFEINKLTNYIENLRDRAKVLREANQPEVVSKLKGELNEIEARKLLVEYLDKVLERDRTKKENCCLPTLY